MITILQIYTGNHSIPIQLNGPPIEDWTQADVTEAEEAIAAQLSVIRRLARERWIKQHEAAQ